MANRGNVRRYDVIIVGAGPAGSVTARDIAAERSGLSVLLVEAKKTVGLPIQCGEALPTQRDIEVTFPGVDCPDLISPPPHVIASRVDGIKFVLPKGQQVVAPVGGLMIHRDRLDQYLFQQAVSAGAEYRLGTRVRRISGNRVYTDDEEFEGGIIVGADGPGSTVSDSFRAFSPNTLLVPCAFVIAEGGFEDTHIEIRIERRFPGGYFWIFPKDGEANIGVGLRGTTQVKQTLAFMLDELRRSTPIEIKSQGGGVVPMGGLKKRVAWEHVALVGDAAGMVFPSNGGGTAQAMLGAHILADVIRNRLPLSEYQLRVDQHLRPAFGRSLRMRQLVDVCRCNDYLLLGLIQVLNQRGWKSFIF